MSSYPRARDLLALLFLTAAAFLVQGYHLGVEDQAIYLPAIKKNLDPGLYPHDAVYFLAQTRLTLFDEAIAWMVRWTHLPLDWTIFVWHIISLFLLLLACRQIAVRLFADRVARWAAVTMVAVMAALPIAGTRVTATAEYLHPRNLAMVAVAFALVAVLDRKLTAFAWLAVAAVLHPLTALFGAFHLAFQAWRAPGPQVGSMAPALLLGSTNDVWRTVLEGKTYYLPLRWTWYEQLGAVGPMVLLAWFARIGKRMKAAALPHVSGRLALSGTVGVAASVVISVTPGLEPLIRAQPMRSLHFVYLLLFLTGGGLLGHYLLRNRLRWILLFLPLGAAMWCAQSWIYPDSPRVELPGQVSKNEWIQAFDWIRRNTPRSALFALDPRHMERPGEDNHGFRAWAERSMLAEYFKDRGMIAILPEWAVSAENEVADRNRWREFSIKDFRRLKARYGVTWVVIEGRPASGLLCRYDNRRVRVCEIP